MGALDDSYDEWLASHHDGDENFGDDPTDPAADQPLWPSPTDPDERPAPRPTRPARPIADIRLDLDGALAYRERYRDRPAADRWVQLMRDLNDDDIARLQVELAAANGPEAPPRGEVPAGSTVIVTRQRSAGATRESSAPHDDDGPVASVDRLAETAAPAPGAPRWPRPAGGQRDLGVGL